jgi:hypothetical protein
MVLFAFIISFRKQKEPSLLLYVMDTVEVVPLLGLGGVERH